MFEVLKPLYYPTGEQTSNGSEYWRVDWRVIGYAADMEDAKLLFGGVPVLREAK